MGSKTTVLRITSYHLSREKAEKHVSRLLQATGAKRPPRGWHSTSYTLSTPKGKRLLVWEEMVREARETGGVAAIQNWIDSQDPYFGGSFGMAVSTSSMSITTTFLGKTRQFNGPARNFPVEQELVGDILEYRSLCCSSSIPGSFVETTRYFRAYLFSCISLVDAFINRHVHIARYKGNTNSKLDELMKPARLDERLSLWLDIFGSRGDSELRKGEKWNEFVKLKRERNLHVHAAEPYYGYQISKMVNPLNGCRKGVGGLIIFLQKEAGHQSNSLFQRLTTAPIIRFCEK